MIKVLSKSVQETKSFQKTEPFQETKLFQETKSFQEPFKFMGISPDGFCVTEDIKNGCILATSDSNINYPFSKLYDSATSAISKETTNFNPSTHFPIDIRQYCYLTCSLYTTAVSLYKYSLCKKEFEKECKKACKRINQTIKEKFIKYINQNSSKKIDLIKEFNDSLAMPKFYRYVIDVFSIIDIIESGVLNTFVEDEQIRNAVIFWMIILYNYIILYADCEFIKIYKTGHQIDYKMVALREIERNSILITIWRNNRLLKSNTATHIYKPEFNNKEAIDLVNLILSNHVNLGINLTVKKLFKSVQDDIIKELQRKSCMCKNCSAKIHDIKIYSAKNRNCDNIEEGDIKDSKIEEGDIKDSKIEEGEIKESEI
jgi:hypothetical protein